jgi:phosphoribosylformylglycinamidine synthase subunit PurS
MYNVTIKVMPHKGLLDPQGKAVLGGLHNLQLTSITDVRVGKNISLQIEANNLEEAKNIATTAAQKLLANAVMEYFELIVEPA